jgi:hypothetical protein
MHIFTKQLLIRLSSGLLVSSLLLANCSTAFAQQPSPSPQQGLKAAEPSPVGASPPGASPAPARTQTTVALFVEQNKDPHKIFVHHTKRTDCASKIDFKILYFTPTKAFLVVEDCKEISPKTLRTEHFSVAALDNNLLKYDGKLLDPEEKTDLTSYIWCEDGNDSANRPVAIKIDVRGRDSALIARLLSKGSAGIEDETMQVQAVPQKTKQTMLYTTGQPGIKPYLSFTVGNFQGLTGYLTYDIDSTHKAHAGVIGQNRKENNVNLSRCFTP